MAKRTEKKKSSGLTSNLFFEGVGIIRRYLAPHRRTLIILAILGLIDATAQAFVPLIAGKIFDAIIALARTPTISLASVVTLIVIWLVLQASSNIISWQTGFRNETMGTVLEAEFIAKGFGRLFEMPLEFHVGKKQGDVGDRISRAADWMQNLVSRVGLTLLPNFLSIIIALIIAFILQWRLALVLLAAILIYAFILSRAAPQMTGLQQKVHRAYGRAYGDAYDSLGNVREIKQAATEHYEKRKMQTAFIRIAVTAWLRLTDVRRRLDFSQRFLVTLTQLIIFVVSVFFVRNGMMTPGELVAFNGYSAMILGPFVILGQNWQMVQNGIVAIIRAEKILNTPPEVYVPKNAVVMDKLGGEVRFDNVSFSYKKGAEILKNVSLHVKPGEKVALVGESGVGKTTIIDLLLGLYFPQKGKITIDGNDLRRLDLISYRTHIGVVPQEPALFNDTIEHNIRYGNFGKSIEHMIEATKRAHAHDFIEGFPKKYKQVVGWRGVKLSIGQKQRIALARAFLRNPDILILDEPTSALDAKSEHLIKESLRQLMEGRTTFIIAHRLSTVREVDTILVLKEGNIVERGSHTALMNIDGGIYRSLYELQGGLLA